MESENLEKKAEVEELPDSWWHRVYIAVVVTTVVVITALWAFTEYFTN